jgi:hypothetical protein
MNKFNSTVHQDQVEEDKSQTPLLDSKYDEIEDELEDRGGYDSGTEINKLGIQGQNEGV